MRCCTARWNAFWQTGPVFLFQINREDMERIRECLSGEEEEETERQVQNFIRLMAGRIADGDLADYLLQSAHDITVRLRNRI